MNVIAMKVEDVMNHPNADALRVYKMTAPQNEVQIVANLENTYQEGDIVAVALSGSILKDGTKIKPCRLRGVASQGMALGSVDAEIGADLSETYCQPLPKTVEIPFQKWTSIELLANVRRNLSILGEMPKLTYRAKVKLHGTNAGVQVTTDGVVAAQKRSQIITSKSDNEGFARWVEANTAYFSALKKDENITIYGEWCGSSIQKGVALSQLDKKIFAVFAIQIGDDVTSPKKLEIRPEEIAKIVPAKEDVFVLPYYGEPIILDFGNEARLREAADTINSWVEAVEKSDPWVKETFGIDGVGEGLVMYPETDKLVPRMGYTEYIFKAKGAKHQVVKSEKAVTIDPAVAASIEEFVSLFATEARMSQGVQEACNGEYDIKLMGNFLKWFSLDVKKESVAELEKSNLTWKEVNKPLSNAARQWYLAGINTLQ